MARRNIDVDKPWHKALPFVQSVEVSGRLLFTSGITARDPQGVLLGVGDMKRQIEVCLDNLGDVLKSADASFDNLVKIVMYTTDIETFSQHPDAWRGHFSARPASTLVEVRRLALPEMMVEIEAVAELGD